MTAPFVFLKIEDGTANLLNIHTEEVFEGVSLDPFYRNLVNGNVAYGNIVEQVGTRRLVPDPISVEGRRAVGQDCLPFVGSPESKSRP